MNRRRFVRLTTPPNASTTMSEMIEVRMNSHLRSPMPREIPIASRTGRRKK
jgi:hypothetical protein